MKWGGFKRAVEARGVTDDTPLDYIILNAFNGGVDVTFRADGHVCISEDWFGAEAARSQQEGGQS